MNRLGGTLKITSLCVPGCRDIERNERAKGLARRGSALGNPLANTVRVPLVTVKGGMYSYSRRATPMPNQGVFGLFITKPDHESSCDKRAQMHKAKGLCEVLKE